MKQLQEEIGPILSLGEIFLGAKGNNFLQARCHQFDGDAEWQGKMGRSRLDTKRGRKQRREKRQEEKKRIRKS